jgi:hypothetical protein
MVLSGGSCAISRHVYADDGFPAIHDDIGDQPAHMAALERQPRPCMVQQVRPAMGQSAAYRRPMMRLMREVS